MEITLTPRLITLLVGVGVYTLMAAISDIRTRRIPNKLNVAAFFAGLVYQGVFNGFAGIGDALAGFALGFGLLFVLWMVGGGGGGDVKLMGGLSVWLGFRLTLYVLVGSVIVVIFGTMAVAVWSMIFHGAKRTKAKYLATGKDDGGKKGRKRKAETVEQRQERRVMAFAVPVALATWFVIAWQLPRIAEAGQPPAGNEANTAETTDQ